SVAMAAAVLIFVAPPVRQSIQARRDEVPLVGETLRLFRLPLSPLLFWSYTICGFPPPGIIEVHLLPYAAACGFPPLESATAYGVLCAFNLLGMVSAGYLADRVNRPLLLGGLYLLRGLPFILLMNITGNLPLLLIFAVAF